MDLIVFERLGVALGLGLLVGLQRQWTRSEIAGIRTFPLITLLGALLAIIEGETPGWLTACGLLGVSLMLLAANLLRQQVGQVDPGMTTEMAALLMYATGAAAGFGRLSPAIAVSGVVVVLLHWKQMLHGLVERIGERDIKAVMNLVLIAMVILPILPDETYGWYHVLNPFRIWLMVVLIVGMSLIAYVAYKLLGPRAGGVLGGLLGGLISSTAVTVSFARQSRAAPQTTATAALVIMLASSVVGCRVLGEIALVAPELLATAAWPLGILMGVMVALSLLALLFTQQVSDDALNFQNPAQLRTAMLFGGMYALMLVLVAAAREHFGETALFAVAAVSGLTDLDAITLSTAELVQHGRLQHDIAWRLILVGVLSNIVFKWVVIGLLGSRQLFIRMALLFGISLATGGLLLIAWPG